MHLLQSPWESQPLISLADSPGVSGFSSLILLASCVCVYIYVFFFLCTCVFACTDMFVYVCMFVCVCNQPRMLYSSSAVSLTFGLHCTGTHQGDYAPLLASAGTSSSTHRNGKCTSPFPTHLHGSDDDIRLLILAYVTSY